MIKESVLFGINPFLFAKAIGTMAKIVIIGGGVAGLSAGIYARKDGHEVTVCERHSTAGGNLTGWQRGEYHIDNCIHWLTGTHPATEAYQTWAELGALGNVNVHQPEALFTCDTHGKQLSAYRDLNRFEQESLLLAPEDEGEIRSLCNAVRAFAAWSGTPIANGLSMSERIRHSPKILRYANLSTKELSKKFHSPLIRKFITCMLGEDFTALALVVTLATFCSENGGIPSGGSLAMAQRMAERFCNLGGILKTNATVQTLHTSGRKVTAVELVGGEILKADYVVCACDPKHVFEDMLGAEMPPALQRLYKNPKMKRFSSVHAAFACENDSLPFQGDFIFELPIPYKRYLHSRFLVLREFSHEPSFAPAGKTVLQAMVFCNEKQANSYIELRKNKPEYKAKKRELSEIFQTAIAEKFPCLRGKIKTLDVWTPATYHRYTGAEAGAYMSFILPKGKLPLPTPCATTQWKNLLLASQWQQPPGGLPTAAALGKRAAKLISQRERGMMGFFTPKSARKQQPV